MKQATSILAILASLALAHQHNQHGHLHKRVDVTVVDWDTVTTTIFVTAGQPYPTDGGDSSVVAAAASSSSSTAAAAPLPVAAEEVPQQAPNQPSLAVPTSAPPPPPPASSYVAPPPPPPSPTSSAPASSNVAAAIASGGTGGGSMQSGDITNYDTFASAGRCGYPMSNSNNSVAVAVSFFHGLSNSGGQPAPGTPCNKMIHLYPNGPGGKSVDLIVADGCGSCAESDLDIPQDFFYKIMPTGPNGASPSAVGRYHGISWQWAE